MKLQCKRCKISWLPRIEGRPKWCPSCHSPYWDKDRVRVVMVAGGNVELACLVSRVAGSGVVVPVSRVPKSKPSTQVQPVTAACKCGATGVMIVGGKRKCAACGRELGA